MFEVTGNSADVEFSGLFINGGVLPRIVFPNEVNKIPEAFVYSESSTCRAKTAFPVMNNILHFSDDISCGGCKGRAVSNVCVIDKGVADKGEK